MKRLMGFALLALLICHALLKAQAGMLSEMLWTSHVTSGLLAVGLIFDLPMLMAIGFLFHLAVATPAYILLLLGHGDTNWTSFLLHSLTPIAGWIAWRKLPLPTQTWWLAWLVCLLLVILCRVFTPEQLNINLAFKSWESAPFLGEWFNYTAVLLFILPQLAAVQWLFNRFTLSAGRKGMGLH